MDSMISFNRGNNRFNLRSAAIIIHKNKVLIQTFEGTDFWVFPGGRVEMGEDTLSTVKREMQEELGEEVSIERLLWCNENFFSLSDLEYHELGYYYLVSLPANSSLVNMSDFTRKELDGTTMIFKWIDLVDVESWKLFPLSIRDRLNQRPEQTEHVIERP
jgi:8-oxo-dGTP pyrophosphatase MutT (NUDIX family)